MTISVQGRHIGFRTDQPGLLDPVYDLLPPGWKKSDRNEVRRLYSLRAGGEGHGRGVRRYNVLYMNASRFERSMDLEYMFDRLEADVQLYVAERARRRIFVHAGVVGWQGKAILLPGRSFSGKTTLVAELLRLGATYYSDEYAVLDRKGRVHPFAKPLTVRHGVTRGRATRHAPEEFGAEVGQKPLPVGLVALTRYKPGVRWRPRRLSAGKAILRLLENTVPARRRPKVSFATLQQVVAGAQVISGGRGEADEIAKVLLRRLA